MTPSISARAVANLEYVWINQFTIEVTWIYDMCFHKIMTQAAMDKLRTFHFGINYSSHAEGNTSPFPATLLPGFDCSHLSIFCIAVFAVSSIGDFCVDPRSCENSGWRSFGFRLVSKISEKTSKIRHVDIIWQHIGLCVKIKRHRNERALSPISREEGCKTNTRPWQLRQRKWMKHRPFWILLRLIHTKKNNTLYNYSFMWICLTFSQRTWPKLRAIPTQSPANSSNMKNVCSRLWMTITKWHHAIYLTV